MALIRDARPYPDLQTLVLQEDHKIKEDYNPVMLHSDVADQDLVKHALLAQTEENKPLEVDPALIDGTEQKKPLEIEPALLPRTEQKKPLEMEFDTYHACKWDNKVKFGHGEVTMPDPPSSFNAKEYLEDPALIDAAKFKVVPHPEAKRYATLDEIPGRIAVVTVVGRTNAPRYQDADPKADQLPCALIMQYLSIKEAGKIPFGNGKFDYVVIMSDEGTPTERKLFEQFGIKIVTMPMPPESTYPLAFDRGAMMKAHGIALDEYDRILLLDGDMFAKTSIENHVLLEFMEDMVTSLHSSSPCAGNWIILRPNKEVHKQVWDVASDRVFSLEKGWNNSGLYTWPPGKETENLCEAGYLIKADRSCSVNDVWVERCRKYRVINWLWMGVNEVQGFYPWVYNNTGLGTSLYLGSSEVPSYSSMLGQGAPSGFTTREVISLGSCRAIAKRAVQAKDSIIQSSGSGRISSPTSLRPTGLLKHVQATSRQKRTLNTM